MIRLTSLLLAVVCGLTTCGQAAASPPPIKDEAHMFSPEAIERATADIQEIKRLYQTDLVFEFVPSVPADNWWNKFKKKVLHSKEPEARSRFYEDWAKRNARAAGPHAIYVLICKEPAPLHVVVVAGVSVQRQKAFTGADGKRLEARLLARFQQEKYDEGLAEAVQLVRKTLQTNRENLVIPVEGFPWAGIVSVILAMVGFWLCLQFMVIFRNNRS